MQAPVLKRVAAVIIAIGFTACVNAANDVDDVKAVVTKKFPQQTVKSVRTTPVKGLYEVVFAPRQVIYVDAKADFAFVGGNLVDVKKKVSLTEDRMAELSRTDFNKLPFELAFKTVRGTGARKVAVFSDPDCPFCKRLEQDTMKSLDNVTVYTFLMPLSMHPDAARKASVVWCNADRQKTWNDWMLDGKIAEGKPECEDAPLAKIAAVAQDVGVTATPTMVFESGEVVAGAIDKDAFETKLAAKKP